MSSTLALPNPGLAGSRLRGRRRPSEVALPELDLEPIRRVRGWHMVERSAFGFVDQVVVTPAAVVAITIRHHVPLEGEAHIQRAWKAIRDAKGSAALMRQMLGENAPEVLPVLVLWGPGAPALPEGSLLVKGVRVVDPARPQLWSHLYDVPVIDELEQRRLARSLRL